MELQSAYFHKVFFIFLYRTNIIARLFVPKQSPVLDYIPLNKEIATPPASQNRSGSSQEHQITKCTVENFISLNKKIPQEFWFPAEF
jgi:hypothetical protein